MHSPRRKPRRRLTRKEKGKRKGSDSGTDRNVSDRHESDSEGTGDGSSKVNTALSCLSAPDRCVSRVGTTEVLDSEKEEYNLRLVMNIRKRSKIAIS